MIVVFVAMVVVVPVPHLVAVPVTLVAISVSVSIPSYLAAAVPAVIAIMIIDYGTLISGKAPVVAIICVVVISAAVVSIMIVPDRAVAEARIIAEARFIGATPFPIFPLTLTAQPVVLDIVIAAFSQPLPVIRIVVSVIVA